MKVQCQKCGGLNRRFSVNCDLRRELLSPKAHAGAGRLSYGLRSLGGIPLCRRCMWHQRLRQTFEDLN